MKYNIEKQRMRRKWYQVKYWDLFDWIFVIVLTASIIAHGLFVWAFYVPGQ